MENYLAKWQTDAILRKRRILRQEGVRIILTKKAKTSLMEWKPINERLMYERFYSSTLKISFIIVYDQQMEAQKRQKRHS